MICSVGRASSWDLRDTHLDWNLLSGSAILFKGRQGELSFDGFFFFKKKLLLFYPVAYICISKSWGYVKTAKDLQGAPVCICACMFCGGVCKVQNLFDAPYRLLIDLEQASSVCAAYRRMRRLVALPQAYWSLKRCREQGSWCTGGVNWWSFGAPRIFFSLKFCTTSSKWNLISKN